MSTYANAAKARLWLDGDGFRAPANTALPANIFAATLTGWEAFGGVKAGFTVETARDVTEVQIWNNESGAPYKRVKQQERPSVAFRAVDYSKATVLTLIRGGSVAETSVGSGVFEMIPGSDETFALIIRVQDGANKKAYYVPLAELGAIPTEAMGAEDDVEGFDFAISPLAPPSGLAVRRFLTENPLA